MKKEGTIEKRKTECMKDYKRMENEEERKNNLKNKRQTIQTDRQRDKQSVSQTK